MLNPFGRIRIRDVYDQFQINKIDRSGYIVFR